MSYKKSMKNILKQILAYSIWTLLALLSGICYMRVVLGPKVELSANFWKIFDWIHNYAMIHVGLMIGSVVALLFILIDVFYLKRKLSHDIKATIIRFLILLAIAIAVGTTHYILEKIVDVI